MTKAMRIGWIAVIVAGCSSPSQAPVGVTPAPSTEAPPKVVAAAPADAAEVLAEPNRPLTDGEVALLKPVFRDGIAYPHVRVIDNSFPLQPENVYMTPRGHIYAPGRLFQADFSRAYGGQREVFVHEMTHVWQYENGMDLIGQGAVEFIHNRGNYEAAYPYELVKGKDLVEYGMEQQASIVEDWYRITVDHAEPQRMTNRGLDQATRDLLYTEVLANFLGDARYARALDPAQIAAHHAAASEKVPPGPQACEKSELPEGDAHLCGWRYSHK